MDGNYCWLKLNCFFFIWKNLKLRRKMVNFAIFATVLRLFETTGFFFAQYSTPIHQFPLEHPNLSNNIQPEQKWNRPGTDPKNLGWCFRSEIRGGFFVHLIGMHFYSEILKFILKNQWMDFKIFCVKVKKNEKVSNRIKMKKWNYRKGTGIRLPGPPIRIRIGCPQVSVGTGTLGKIIAQGCLVESFHCHKKWKLWKQ